MIVGTFAIILNMLNIMALSMLVSVVVISLYFSLYFKFKQKNHTQYSAKIYQYILWTFVLLPWLVGIVVAIVLIFFDSALIVIQSIAPNIPNIPNIHWHHIDEFYFYSWHGVFGIFVVAFTLIVLTKCVVSAINNINKIKILASLAKSNRENTYLLATDSPMAFAGGYFRPKVFVTTGLQKSLSTEEMEIILIHEYEHVRSKDSLKKLIFNFLSSIFPNVISTKLEASMSLTMEQCADQSIEQKQYDKSRIAETMLKVNKMLSQSKQFNLDKTIVCHYGLDEIEHRIKYLFNIKSNKKYPVYFVFAGLVFLSFGGIYFAPSAHHFIEQILS